MGGSLASMTTNKKHPQKSGMRGLARVAMPAMAVIMLTVMLTGALLLSGCSRTKTYKDGLGSEIKVKGIPKRIVSLSPAHTETLFVMGVGDRIVGVSDFCNRPPQAADIEKVGDAFNLNLEKLVSLKPDLVICPGTKDFVSESVKEVQRAGLTAYVSGPSTIQEVLDDIENLSKILGAEKAGKRMVGDIESELAALSKLHEGEKIPTVFLCVDSDLWTVGPNSFMNGLLKAGGGKNIIEDESLQYFQISMEELLVKDPDVILITIPEDQAAPLLTRPGWQSLTAVKEDRVHFVDGDLVSRPGFSLVYGVQELVRVLHPNTGK